jgi:hypothetical protein
MIARLLLALVAVLALAAGTAQGQVTIHRGGALHSPGAEGITIHGGGLSTPAPIAAGAYYALPNNDGDCPGNCRQIPWLAGSDQWNSGTLPTYTGVNCTSGLTEGDGTTDNASAIQTCLDNLSTQQAAVLPAGIYYCNGNITIPSDKALRGAGSGSASAKWLPTYRGLASDGTTEIKMGASCLIRFGTSSPTFGSELAINTPAKGATTLTCTTACTGISVNDWISIYEDADSTIPATATGDSGTCTWCGNNTGSNLIQQFAQVTAVNGTTLTISRPVYYAYDGAQNPTIREVTFNVARAGIEQLKLHGFATRGSAIVYMRGALFSWVKDVETYKTGNQNKSNHVTNDYGHANEIRDSYMHYGIDSSSDTNYGLAFFFWNSDHKIENNILRHHRHSLAFEGGGSGVAILYNYIDDNYTDDLTYLGSARTNHGAHPMFHLYEGNHISHLEADDVWGSSSHIVLFRNWLRGESTGTDVPSFPPSGGFWAAHIDRLNVYYSLVGNVLGVDNATWAAGRLEITQSSHCDSGTRTAYAFGCSDGVYFAPPRTTAIKHGNYDYVTDSVSFWDGGANHTLKTSLYYEAKPAFFGPCNWPVFGPDVGGITGTHPAQQRFVGATTCQ